MASRRALHLEQPRYSLERQVNLRDQTRGYQAISLAISRLMLSLPNGQPIVVPSVRPRTVVCDSEQFDLLKRQKADLRSMYPEDIEAFVLNCTVPARPELTAKVSSIQAAANQFETTDVFAVLASGELEAERTHIFKNLFVGKPIPALDEPHRIRMFRTHAPPTLLEPSLEQFQQKIDNHFLPDVSLGELEFNMYSASSERALGF